ncbi:MAG: hypothetical protein O2970_11530 [Proteobacteria bacterium]|nr:hypothetical protein [Pseudomonadota bacterium]
MFNHKIKLCSIAVSISLLFVSSNSNAATGCISKRALDELTTASVNYNYTKIDKLLKTGICKEINSGYKVVEKGFLKSKVALSNGTTLWISN